MNKNFKVECEMDGSVLNLSVTLNGYQWCTTRIYDPENEVPQIIKALQPFNKGKCNVCTCDETTFNCEFTCEKCGGAMPDEV